VLQGKIDRLIDIGTCYGLEKSVDKTTVPTTDYDRSKKTEECGVIQPFGLLEIEFRISVTKAGFNKKKVLFACKFDKTFKE